MWAETDSKDTDRQKDERCFPHEKETVRRERRKEGSIKHTRDEYSTLQTRTRISTWRPLVILKAKAENSQNWREVLPGSWAKLHLRPAFYIFDKLPARRGSHDTPGHWLLKLTVSFSVLDKISLKKKKNLSWMPQTSIQLSPTGQCLNLQLEQAGTCLWSVSETLRSIGTRWEQIYIRWRSSTQDYDDLPSLTSRHWEHLLSWVPHRLPLFQPFTHNTPSNPVIHEEMEDLWENSYQILIALKNIVFCSRLKKLQPSCCEALSSLFDHTGHQSNYKAIFETMHLCDSGLCTDFL